MLNQRNSERFEVPLEIRVTWPGRTQQIAVTKDFSDGGAFLKVFFDEIPPRYTEMELQLTSQVMGRDAPVLKGRVIRATFEGIAFEFIHPPEN